MGEESSEIFKTLNELEYWLHTKIDGEITFKQPTQDDLDNPQKNPMIPKEGLE